MADSMTKKTICQLLLIVLLIQHNVGTGFLFTPPNGSLKKDKDYSLFYVGETLTLHCKKFQNFTGTVRFMQGNVGVSHRWVTQVNETYARMDKTVTSEDFPVTTYQCSDDSGLIDSIGGIFTEYRPQKATDLQMVWLNRETLSFSWRFGDTPFKNYHLVAVNNVTAEWSNNPDNDTSWQLCYHGNLTTNFCEPWPYTNQRNNVTVRVNFTSEKRNNLVTTVFPSLPVREHAKPNPVQRVEVVALNSTTAQLNITAEDSGTLNFSITYYATSGQNGSITKVTGLTTKRTFEIPKLHPHRTYGFEVRAKYQWGFLSELPDVNLTLLMPEAAPSSAPVVNSSSYYLDPSGCSQQKNLTYGYIYYQEVPEEDRNGDITKYTAEVRVKDGIQTFVQPVHPGLPRTLKLASVPCHTGFNVTLYASTVVGRSPLTSLRVQNWDPELDESVTRLKLRIKAKADGVIIAEWNPPPSDKLSLFIYYCRKNSVDHNMCDDPISLLSVDPEVGRHPLPSANSNMKFGVAAVRADGMTTGIKFTDCVYNPAREPGSPPTLRALPQTDHIILNWEGRECDANNRILILNYEIKVCEVPGETSCKTYTVDGSASTFKLEAVSANTKYSVYIRANTTSSETPLTPFSEPVYTKLQPPAAKGLTMEEIGGIVGGMLCLLTLFGVLLFCFCRDRFRVMKSRFSRTFTVPDPPPLEKPASKFQGFADPKTSELTESTRQAFVPVNSNNNNQDKNTQRQDSGDSGYENGDSPQSSPTTEQGIPFGYSKLEDAPTKGADIPDMNGPYVQDVHAVDTPGVNVPSSTGFVPAAANEPIVNFVMHDTTGGAERAKDKFERDQAICVAQMANQNSGYVQCTTNQNSGYVQCTTESGPPSAEDQVVEQEGSPQDPSHPAGSTTPKASVSPDGSRPAQNLHGGDEEEDTVLRTSTPASRPAPDYVKISSTDGTVDPITGRIEEEHAGNLVQATYRMNLGYLPHDLSSGPQIGLNTQEACKEGGHESSEQEAAESGSGYFNHPSAEARSGYVTHPSTSYAVPQPATVFERAEEEDPAENGDLEPVFQQVQPQQEAVVFPGYLSHPSALTAVPQPRPSPEGVEECHALNNDPDPVFPGQSDQGAGEFSLTQAGYVPHPGMSSNIPLAASLPLPTTAESNGIGEEADCESLEEADNEKSSSGVSSLSEAGQNLTGSGYVPVESAQALSSACTCSNTQSQLTEASVETRSSNPGEAPTHLTEVSMENRRGDPGEAHHFTRLESGYSSPSLAEHAKPQWPESGSTGDSNSHLNIPSAGSDVVSAAQSLVDRGNAQRDTGDRRGECEEAHEGALHVLPSGYVDIKQAPSTSC